MNGIPTLKNDDEYLFKKLVLEGLTIAAIKGKMSPTLDGFEEIPLIRKMVEILAEGEN
jgi:hypothetical protein